jgi:hypothetical protein
LHWFAGCGHFPQLDVPAQTTQLILSVVEGRYAPGRIAQQAAGARRTGVLTGVALAALAGLFLLSRRARPGQ